MRWSEWHKWLWRTFELYEIIVWLGGTFVISAAVHTALEQVQEAPLAWQIVLYIGIALLFLVVVRLIMPRILRRTKAQADHLPPIETDEGFIKLPELGFEFYSGRDALGKTRPLGKQLKSTDTIWALWNTGTVAYLEVTAEVGGLKRLFLPHPDKSSLQLFAESFNLTWESCASDIRNLTKVALDKKVDVRWFKGLTTDTIMIGNPYSDDGWIQVETVIACAPAFSCPSFRITKHNQPEPFDTLVKAYDKLWNDKKKCIEPPRRELGKTK